MYRILWGKFAKCKINQLNYRLNPSPEFKPKSSFAWIVGFLTTNSTIDVYKSSIIEFFSNLYFNGDFCELGELFNLWISKIFGRNRLKWILTTFMHCFELTWTAIITRVLKLKFHFRNLRDNFAMIETRFIFECYYFFEQ